MKKVSGTRRGTPEFTPHFERRRAAMEREKQDLSVALEHGRAMFEYYASQRFTSIRFYFIALAIVIAGYANLLAVEPSSLNALRGELGLFFGVTGVFISVCFWFLDLRNEMLVHSAETLIEVAEKALAERTHLCEYETIAETNKAPLPWIRYGYIMPIMCIFFIAIFGVMSIVSVREFPLAPYWFSLDNPILAFAILILVTMLIVNTALLARKKRPRRKRS